MRVSYLHIITCRPPFRFLRQPSKPNAPRPPLNLEFVVAFDQGAQIRKAQHDDECHQKADCTHPDNREQIPIRVRGRRMMVPLSGIGSRAPLGTHRPLKIATPGQVSHDKPYGMLIVHSRVRLAPAERRGLADRK